MNHPPTVWWLLTNPFLWQPMDILWLWYNHNDVMQLLLRVCSVDRIGTIQCSMQLTAARLRHHWYLSSIAAPQIGVHRRVPDSKMQEHNQLIFSGGKMMQLVAVPNKYIRLWKFWRGAIARFLPLWLWAWQDVTVGVKLILQNIPNKIVHFIIHTEFSSDWSSKSSLFNPEWINVCFLIREIRSNSKPQKIQTNRQWAT